MLKPYSFKLKITDITTFLVLCITGRNIDKIANTNRTRYCDLCTNDFSDSEQILATVGPERK